MLPLYWHALGITADRYDTYNVHVVWWTRHSDGRLDYPYGRAESDVAFYREMMDDHMPAIQRNMRTIHRDE